MPTTPSIAHAIEGVVGMSTQRRANTRHHQHTCPQETTVPTPAPPTHITPRPSGGNLHIGGLAELFVTGLLDLLNTNDRLRDDLWNVLEHTTPTPDPHLPEKHLHTEELIRELAEALSTTHLSHTAMTVLRAQLGDLIDAQGPSPAPSTSGGGLLRRAADVIVVNGLHKGGHFYDEQMSSRHHVRPGACPVCTIGALRVAANHAPDDATAPVTEAVRYLSPRVYSHTTDDDPAERIADWNDSDGVTAAEVVATLRRAADDWDREHTPDLERSA